MVMQISKRRFFRPKEKPKHSHHHHHHHHHHHNKNKDGNRAGDREHEIIINRLVLLPIAWTLCIILGASDLLILGFQLYLMGSLCTAIAYRLNPRPSNLRRFAGLCVEFSSGTFIFYVGGADIAAVYPVYIWVILGFGFRFGIKWLILSAFMATSSFAWIVTNVDFWIENRSLSIGLLIGLIAVPAYCSTLITKLSKAKEEAEAANKAKSLFLASISHELRTPLNAIIGYGTYLLDMKLSEKQHQMVSTSVSAGRHLLHLITQLLSFAQSDSRDELPAAAEFRVTDILAEVRDILGITASEKGIDLHLQAEVMSDSLVSGQVDYIKNILINLTSNAVKFTEQGHVLLKCGISRDDDVASLWCSVTDTGPGIAKDAQEKIFNVFQQADESILDKFGGTGLGLAICRQLAGQLGGDVSVESSLGAGSTFTFSCPIDLVTSDNETSSEEKLRILSFGYDMDAPQFVEENEAVEVEHFHCQETDDLDHILDPFDLASFDIALVDHRIAAQHDEQSKIWQHFYEAKLPPVLLSDNDMASIDEIKLRAAFASVLPATPDFDTVRSAVRIGCSFHKNSSQTAESDISDHQVPPQRILVADDNRTNQMVLDTILSNAGHDVVAVSDGDLALKKLESDSFDMVFLDINMPNLGGIECCKLWRQIEGPRDHIPIIGLTADATETTEKKCLDAGMDLRLTKPIEAGLLLQTIADQVKGDRDLDHANLEDPLNVVHQLGSKAAKFDITPIDEAQIDYLRSIGDDAFVQSVVDAYLDDTDEIMIAFEKAVRSGQVDDFRFQAHAFKSGANNIGAHNLSAICGKLEVISEPEFKARGFEFLELVRTETQRIDGFLRTMDQPQSQKAAIRTSSS